VQDAIAVMLKDGSRVVGRLLPIAAAGKAALLREGRKHLFFVGFQLLADRHVSCRTTIQARMGRLRFSGPCFAGVSIQLPRGKLPVSWPQAVGIPIAKSYEPRGKSLAAVWLRSYLAM